MLLAMTIDAELDGIDPDRKIDIDRLIAQSASNVVGIGDTRKWTRRKNGES
jgi:hypothetical protein